MAKATVITQKIDKVVLELDEEEVSYLSTVLRRTGGNPDKSLRRAALRITRALAEEGVETEFYDKGHLIDRSTDSVNSIYFVDFKS